MKRATLILMTVVVFTLMATPLLSHHSMATYDQTTLISIEGVVSKIEWRNPHSWITLTVANTNGKTVAQRIEIAGPSALVTRGFEKTALQIGRAVTIDSWLPKDSGSSPPSGRTLTLEDGRRFDVGDNFDKGATRNAK